MSKPAAPDEQGTSTRPYLIRALHDWCADNGFTPYIAVHVTAGVQVPMEYVKNNEIVLNVGFDATSGLQLGNEVIGFKARFGGIAREIMVPVDHVVAIYARENGQGMAFPAPTAASSSVAEAPAEPSKAGLRLATPGVADAASSSSGADDGAADDTPPDPAPPTQGGRPSLKRVK